MISHWLLYLLLPARTKRYGQLKPNPLTSAFVKVILATERAWNTKGRLPVREAERLSTRLKFCLPSQRFFAGKIEGLRKH